MHTAQDIREKIFDKARIGGYDMASVDDFLEELADDAAASQKENAVLKSKMKVLVEKIEEYRRNEETLNMALLSAQKLAIQIESDARTKAADTIAAAEEQARATIGGIQALADIEEKRLEAAKAAYAEFVGNVRSQCTAQLARLDQISAAFPVETKTEAPVEAQPAPASADELDVDSIFSSRSGNVSQFDKTQPFSL